MAARKETTLTKDIASMLYKTNEGQEYYDDLIDHMSRCVHCLYYCIMFIGDILTCNQPFICLQYISHLVLHIIT